jgi:hypothetical protein
MKAFTVDVPDLATGVLLLNTLADYDLFQLANNIKPDYANAGGIRIWCADNGDGVPGWEDWEDEETGEYDPIKFLKG